MMRRTLLLCAALLGAHPAWAWTHVFDQDGVTGTLTKDDATTMRTECRMRMAVPPAKVLAALTDYDHLGQWLPATVDYRVLRRDGSNAVFYRQSQTPFFLPDMFATVQATVTETPGAPTRVTWHRLSGSIQVFDASFEVQADGGGTLVTYRVHTSVPDLPAPAFVVKRLGASAIVDTLRGLYDAARRRP